MEIQEPKDNNTKFYTISEVSQILGVSVSTVRKWIKDQELKYYVFAGKYRVNKSDLKEFLEDHKNS